MSDNITTGVTGPEGAGSAPAPSMPDTGAAVQTSSTPGATQATAAEPQERVVPLKALEDERRKRQELEWRLNEMARPKPSPEPADEEPKYDDSDIVTVADMKRILAAQQRQQTKASNESRYRENLAKARTFPDFEETVRLAEDLIATNPEFAGMDEIILKNPNAPLMAYKLGQLHPQYRQQNVTKQTTELVNKLNHNLSQPPPVPGGAASPVFDESERIRRMSKAEFEEFDRQVMYGK